MNDWQPIESAPKDGTRVLLWLPDCLSLPNLDRCSGEAVAARFITEFKINGGHGDEVMRRQKEDREFVSNRPGVQGFIDQWGVFMDRKEAWKVAKAAGQILYRCGGDGEELYSENLY